MLGRSLLKFWGSSSMETEEIVTLLQIDEPRLARLHADRTAVPPLVRLDRDLPGRFYLQVVEKLYKQNELSGGSFVALGETVDLKKVAGALVPAGGAR